MFIKRFGIRLVRLQEDKIDLVRLWRNAPHIRDFMEYREFISPEMQKKWFESLDPLRDFYFIIEHHENPVGLIHTSDIDWESGTGHSGLFIWEKTLLGSHIPVLASLSMVDFFFSFCRLEKIFAKVMQANKVAVKYNSSLGFVSTGNHIESDFRQYVLTKENYFKATSALHDRAELIGNGLQELSIESDLMELLRKHNAVNSPSGNFLTIVN